MKWELAPFLEAVPSMPTREGSYEADGLPFPECRTLKYGQMVSTAENCATALTGPHYLKKGVSPETTRLKHVLTLWILVSVNILGQRVQWYMH